MHSIPLSQIRVDRACFESWQRVTDHSFVQLPNNEITTREGIADAQVLDDGRLKVVCQASIALTFCVIVLPNEWWIVDHAGTETRLPSLAAFGTRTRDEVKTTSMARKMTRLNCRRC